MLTISLESHEPGDSFIDDRLIVNGVLLSSSSVSRLGNEPGLQASVQDWKDAPMLAQHSISTLLKYFTSLQIALVSPLPEFTLTSELVLRESSKKARLRLNFSIEIEEWAGPWTLGEYRAAIEQVLAHSALEGPWLVDMSLDEANQFIFQCTQTGNKDSAFQDELSSWTEILSQIIRTAKENLATEFDRNTLVTFFNFPQEISTACEQYLLYFVQFLRDLGIGAGATIKHEAHHVLFSVTPEEGARALDRIREALEIYLRLPDSPDFAAQAPAYGDIAVQQLQANIFHLKGQLAVAGAVLEAKNARIEALQLANFTYQQLLATQQQLAAIPLLPSSASDANVEPLVPGVIDVTKYEGKGFTVNFAEILRRLKRRFDQ